jgi:hypothetical protein
VYLAMTKFQTLPTVPYSMEKVFMYSTTLLLKGLQLAVLPTQTLGGKPLANSMLASTSLG